ncbi:MAG: hypothetical protein QOF58_4047 [Pseudonocardiales bacterium]|nr:hypothetical protein [Pseudonocardiales bacterium]
MQEQYRRLLFNTHNIRIVSAEAAVASSSRVLWEYEKARPVAFTSTDLAKVFVQDPGPSRAPGCCSTVWIRSP